MLNAFRHLRSIHYCRLGAREAAFFVLNAFRHLRSIHNGPGCKAQCRRHHVLNAFRHLRSIHSVIFLSSFVVYRVLNAFRHLRSIHPPRLAKPRLALPVLNAFRHLRSIHQTFRPTMAFTRCAQRLSASQINSPGFHAQGLSPGPVLNAFRHLRSIHARLHLVALGCFPDVLNAFRHLRSIHVRCLFVSCLAPSGAQRLSASQINSHQHFDVVLAELAVLNAFRHLRSIHGR